MRALIIPHVIKRGNLNLWSEGHHIKQTISTKFFGFSIKLIYSRLTSHTKWAGTTWTNAPLWITMKCLSDPITLKRDPIEKMNRVWCFNHCLLNLRQKLKRQDLVFELSFKKLPSGRYLSVNETLLSMSLNAGDQIFCGKLVLKGAFESDLVCLFSRMKSLSLFFHALNNLVQICINPWYLHILNQ